MTKDVSPDVPRFCAHCGEESDDLVVVGGIAAHAACLARYPLDPPRYCSICRRRMVVRVTPAGWEATCSRHGVINSGDVQVGVA